MDPSLSANVFVKAYQDFEPLSWTRRTPSMSVGIMAGREKCVSGVRGSGQFEVELPPDASTGHTGTGENESGD